MRRFIFSPSTLPSFNLAAEEFLFSAKEDDFVFLYVNEPSVIIGSNQAVENEVDLNFCSDNHIRIFRRLSGGGAVYHDTGNLNYCFIHAKTTAPLSADFLKPVVKALTSLNIPVETGKRKDLWLDGYKISGTASHVSKNRELHHGTLLYNTDLKKLQQVLNPEKRDVIRKATASILSPVKNICTFIEQKGGVAPDKSTFFEKFTRILLDFYDIEVLTSFSGEEMEKIRALQSDKYTQQTWNYIL